jgi:DNA repair protein RadC
VSRQRVDSDAWRRLSAAAGRTGRRGGDRGVNAGDRGTNRVCATLERLGGAEIVLTPQRRARFLHGLLDSRDLFPRPRENIVWELGRLRGFEPFRCRCQRRRDFSEQAFGAAARRRAARCGLAGGALGTLAAVERMVQRQAVITLGCRGVRLREGLHGRGEFGGGIAFGSRGARRLDRTLRLVHLLVRRLGTGARGKSERERHNPGCTAYGEHRRQYTQHAGRVHGTCRDLREAGNAEWHMKELAPNDRPREKLARIGAAALGDNELVALVLGHGTAKADALTLANALLARVGGVRGLARAGLTQVLGVPGVGTAHAARVLAAIELGRRAIVQPRDARARFNAPDDLARFLVPQFGWRPIEHFGALLLDGRNRLLRTAVVSVGTLDASVIHPRDIFREAALEVAAAVVLFHNHPSGDPTPSPEDVLITQRMVHAGVVMGIEVLDHLVLAETSYFSFRENRQLT